jgi:uroporphyrinogen III methyltransferase/synthase
MNSQKICCIGPGTAAAVNALHLKVDLIPEEYVAESLVKAFTEEHLSGRRILLPRAAVARDVVPKELEKRGASVEVVEAYRTVAPTNLIERAAEVLARKPHWILFGSSSAVKNLTHAAEAEALQGVKIASIGPVTSETVRDRGLEVDAEANPHTMEGLIAALIHAGK